MKSVDLHGLQVSLDLVQDCIRAVGSQELHPYDSLIYTGEELVVEFHISKSFHLLPLDVCPSTKMPNKQLVMER